MREWTNPEMPITSGQQQLSFGEVVPSSEAHFFDVGQQGVAINQDFTQNFETTVTATYGPSVEAGYESGIFQYNNISGQFHYPGNVPSGLGERLEEFIRPPLQCPPRTSAVEQRDPINSFRVLDSVIYHKRYNKTEPTEILYISSYLCQTTYNRYGDFDSYYNAGFGGN